jgi:hypothetical protein
MARQAIEASGSGTTLYVAVNVLKPVAAAR